MKHTGPLWGIWKIEEPSEVLFALLQNRKEYLPQLFSVKSYGGADVLATTEIAAKRAGITLVRAAECRDVDTPEDLELLAHGIISGKIRAPRTEAFLREIGKIA